LPPGNAGRADRAGGCRFLNRAARPAPLGVPTRVVLLGVGTPRGSLRARSPGEPRVVALSPLSIDMCTSLGHVRGNCPADLPLALCGATSRAHSAYSSWACVGSSFAHMRIAHAHRACTSRMHSAQRAARSALSVLAVCEAHCAASTNDRAGGSSAPRIALQSSRLCTATLVREGANCTDAWSLPEPSRVACAARQRPSSGRTRGAHPRSNPRRHGADACNEPPNCPRESTKCTHYRRAKSRRTVRVAGPRGSFRGPARAMCTGQ